MIVGVHIIILYASEGEKCTLFCVRRPIRFRSPSNRIPYATRSDSVRRPIRFRTPSDQIAFAVQRLSLAF